MKNHIYKLSFSVLISIMLLSTFTVSAFAEDGSLSVEEISSTVEEMNDEVTVDDETTDDDTTDNDGETNDSPDIEEPHEHAVADEDWEIVLEPTCTANGLKQAICSVCEETVEEEIPSIAHHYVNHICTYCGKSYGGLWVVKGEDGVWYSEIDGERAEDYTGFAPNENGLWYVVDGVVDFSVNSVLYDEVGIRWLYVKASKFTTSYTGLAENMNGWWRVVNGVVDFTTTGVYENENGWWRVENGRVNFNAKGVFENENGWWYVKGGRVRFDYTGIQDNANGWWRIESGKVNFRANGVFENENGWWKVENGKVNFQFTGVAVNSNGMWYLKNGAVIFSKTGSVKCDNKTYNVKSGRIISGGTTVESYAIKALNSCGWNLKAAYGWVINNISYNKYCVPVDGSYGVTNYAIYGFKNKKGNCYTFASCFYEMAKLLGYDVSVVKGTVPHRDGTQGAHSWNEIRINGTTYVFDPQYEQQLIKGGKKTYTQYMFTYGTKGTLRYSIGKKLA